MAKDITTFQLADASEFKLDTRLAFGGGNCSHVVTDFTTNPPTVGGSDVTFSESSGEGDFYDAFSVDCLDDEAFEGSSCHSIEKLIQSSLQDIPITRTREKAKLTNKESPKGKSDGNKKRKQIGRGCSNNFSYNSEVEQHVFLLLKKQIFATMVHSKTITKQLNEAAQWIYAIAWDSTDPFNFQNSCLALGADPDIVRGRIQLEYWKRQIRFNKPLLPFLAYLPPVEDRRLAEQIIGHKALILMQIVWHYQSISRTLLHELSDKQGVSEHQFINVLEHLEDIGFLLSNNQYYYYTGKWGYKYDRSCTPPYEYLRRQFAELDRFRL